MPRPPLPPELQRFLQTPRPAVVATLLADGSPVTAACWFEWSDGQVLLAMEASGRRVRNLRRDPRVALTALGDDWYHHVSILGRAVEVKDDEGFEVIDRMSIHYLGTAYEPRDEPIIAVVVEVDRWHAFGDPPASFDAR